MKSNRLGQTSKRRRSVKNPVAPGGPVPQPFLHLRRLADVPGVDAILGRARMPYVKNPLTEDEAFNLICEAREDEPTYPIKKLFKKLNP